MDALTILFILSWDFLSVHNPPE